MRRLARILLTAATVLSLSLAAAVFGLWTASPLDLVRRTSAGGRHVYAGVLQGALQLSIYDHKPEVGESFGPSRDRSFAGVRVTRYDGTSRTNHAFRLSVPLPFVAALPLVLPVGRIIARHHRRARVARLRAARLCAACGYDLRATPDRCPECGTIPAR